MKNIVCSIHPFDLEQQIIVYDNGNKIALEHCSLDDISVKIIQLSAQYNLTDITLTGSRIYGNKTKQKIEEKELSLYHKNKLNIKLF